MRPCDETLALFERFRPEPLDMDERLRAFGVDDRVAEVARLIWTILEPEAARVAETNIDQWNRFFPAGHRVEPGDRPAAVERVVAGLRELILDPGGQAWVVRTERRVALAFDAGVSLTGLFALGGAGFLQILEILGRRHDCSKEERREINDVAFRLRSLQCEVYATLYTNLLEAKARAGRDRLAALFNQEIAGLVERTGGDGAALRDQTDRTAQCALGMLGNASEVAAAAEESATAMQEAA